MGILPAHLLGAALSQFFAFISFVLTCACWVPQGKCPALRAETISPLKPSTNYRQKLLVVSQFT